jgi:hypothetical protein
MTKGIHLGNRKRVSGDDSYSTFDVSKICDIPRERFRDWIVKKFISPDKVIENGIMVFTSKSLILIFIFKQLIESGYQRDFASVIVKKISEYELKNYDSLALTFPGKIVEHIIINIKNVKLIINSKTKEMIK